MKDEIPPRTELWRETARLLKAEKWEEERAREGCGGRWIEGGRERRFVKEKCGINIAWRVLLLGKSEGFPPPSSLPIHAAP